MYEITNKNFHQRYPEILDNLEKASFIAIDCEFSGLSEKDYKSSLFDSADEIFYKKQRNNANYHIVEFGLSMFQYERDTNNFNVVTYSFYLLPFANHKKNSKFTWQMSSVDFLCNYNFNFNKVFYDGVSYVNKKEEHEIFEMIDTGTIAEIFNQEDIKNYMSQTYKWVKTAMEGEKLTLKLEGKQLALTHVLQYELRKNVPNIWTHSPDNDVIIVTKISTREKTKLMEDPDETDSLRRKIFDAIFGFSKLMNEIEGLKIPIIGHNVLTDLTLMYLQFYHLGPVSYGWFKKQIHYTFPNIYDTKMIATALQAKLPKEECWQTTRLCELFSFFKTNPAMRLLSAPLVLSKIENYSDSGKFHDAGYDSFCTGYVFVKMAHLLMIWDDKKAKFNQAVVSKSLTALMASVSHMSNLIYVPRSEVKWIDLNGPDPKKNPPELLLIYARGRRRLDTFQITEKLSSYYSADFKPLNSYSGMIAISNKNHAKEIRTYFQTSDDFVVSDYSFLKHSFWGKTLIRSFLLSAFLFFSARVFVLPKFLRLH